MAPALALTLAAALASAGPLAGRAPSAEEVALASATAAYKNALDLYNSYALFNGSVQDEKAVRLHAAKEAARRDMIRAERAAGKRHAPLQPQDGPLVQAAPADAAVPAQAGEPRDADVSGRKVRRVLLAGAGLVGSGLLAWGLVGLWAKRPRTLACPGCGRKLKVPGRGIKARCPKCKKVFAA